MEPSGVDTASLCGSSYGTMSSAPSESGSLMKQDARIVSSAPSESGSLIKHDPQHGAQLALDETPATPISPARFAAVMAVLMAASFLAALDGTITTTLTLPLLQTFHDPSLLSWTGSAYFIASACIQPIIGQTADVYSRKATLTAAFLLFGAGNLLIACAPHPAAIILGRLLAGAGGGAMGTAAAIIATDIVPPRARGLWQGVLNIWFGAGHGLGGVCGGLAHEMVNWRLAFLLQMPLAVGLAVASGVCVPEAGGQRCDGGVQQTLDKRGAALVVAGMGLLLYGLNSSLFAGTQPSTVAALALGFASLAAYAHHALHSPSPPVLPLRRLQHRTVGAICTSAALVSAGFTGAEYFLPIEFQLDDASTLAAGARLVPVSIGGALGSIGVGAWLRRREAAGGWATSILLVVVVGASAGMATRAVQGWPVAMAAACAAMGLGYAGALTATLPELLAVLERHELALVTSLWYSFRHVGSALGVVASAGLFQWRLSALLLLLLPDDASAELRRRLGEDPELRLSLPAALADHVEDAFRRALQAAFGVAAGACGLGMAAYWAGRRARAGGGRIA